MRLSAIIVSAITVMLSLVSSCSESNASKDTESAVYPDTSSLSYQAWKMRNDGEPSEKFIAKQIEAVEQMRRGESNNDPVEVLEQMGFFYNVIGDYASSIRYYKEAEDSLRAKPISARDEGAIQLFADIGSLYALLGITETALEYSDSAIAESKRQNGLMLSDVYRFRADIYQLEYEVDSASHCYDMALEAINNGPTRADKDVLRAMVLGEKAYLMLVAYADNPDSVAWSVRTLEQVVDYDEIDPSNRYFSLGYGYTLQGRPDKGLPLMRKAREEFKEQGDIELLNAANGVLMKAYAGNGMYHEMAELFPEYEQVADSFLRVEKANALIGAIVKHDLKTAEDRNTILALQLEVERDESFLFYSIGSLILVSLVLCSIILLLRNRLLNQKRIMQERELLNLNQSNTLLTERVDTLEKDLSAGMNSNSTILSSPQLITGQEEGKFRRAFNVLYPKFIPSLKQEFPALSSNDELLCMLLYLKHTTEEISVYLGISRPSVNSARYRLRTKFKLPKSEDLDTFLTSRPG